MKRFIAAHIAAVGFGLALLAWPVLAVGPEGSQDTLEATTQKTPQRFEFYNRQGLPAEYRGKANPNLLPTVPVVIKGADIYNARCASCHGVMGFGNGVAAGKLRIKPADLAWSLSNPKVKDDFLYWTIAEGGVQFGTAMPAYKSDLKENQIWQVITYMHAAFEGREAGSPAPSERHALLGRRAPQ